VAGRTSPAPLFGLAPGGVCRASLSPGCWCALTLRLTPAPFHPYPTRRSLAVCFLLHFPVLRPPPVRAANSNGGHYPPPRPVEPGLSSPRPPPAPHKRKPTPHHGRRPSGRLADFSFHCTASPPTVATGVSPVAFGAATGETPVVTAFPEDHKKAAEVSCRDEVANIQWTP